MLFWIMTVQNSTLQYMLYTVWCITLVISIITVINIVKYNVRLKSQYCEKFINTQMYTLELSEDLEYSDYILIDIIEGDL